MIFRAATGDDIPAIIALLADDELGAARESSDPARYLDAFQAISEDPNQYLAVADDGGRVVGTVQLTFIPGLSHRGAWRGQIEAVRVHSGHRGTGLGSRMIGWAIEECRTRGCRLVQLTSDITRVDAHRFYEKLGFTPSHTGFKLKLS
ncbi:GNAT family N-acetyltransferase [Pseudonocardiaceae bacterium YIM PH 21723]|nr:GNAT family N-acetyltransferase [Pseudonocardiaceae bacterium YIM PH 21723]